jgi:hypothetical protein
VSRRYARADATGVAPATGWFSAEDGSERAPVAILSRNCGNAHMAAGRAARSRSDQQRPRASSDHAAGSTHDEKWLTLLTDPSTFKNRNHYVLWTTQTGVSRRRRADVDVRAAMAQTVNTHALRRTV